MIQYVIIILKEWFIIIILMEIIWHVIIIPKKQFVIIILMRTIWHVIIISKEQFIIIVLMEMIHYYHSQRNDLYHLSDGNDSLLSFSKERFIIIIPKGMMTLLFSENDSIIILREQFHYLSLRIIPSLFSRNNSIIVLQKWFHDHLKRTIQYHCSDGNDLSFSKEQFVIIILIEIIFLAMLLRCCGWLIYIIM